MTLRLHHLNPISIIFYFTIFQGCSFIISGLQHFNFKSSTNAMISGANSSAAPGTVVSIVALMS